MLFNSPIFLFLFLPGTVGAYIVLRQLAGPRAVLGLLLGSWLLTFGIVGDLLALAYFKYTDFLIDTANTLLQTNFTLPYAPLPIGISFFTFQKIAYLVDSSRGEVAEHDFLEYCFFVSFFPQLLAGPIVKHQEIFSQIKGPWAFGIKPSNFIVGLTIFIIGLFKKLVLADNFAPSANTMFEAAAAGDPLDFFFAWQGVLAFKFQLYFDFCGYSEMALGSARLFGVQLPLNFNSPYRALSIVDYWRRWHMTLSRFLRDYIYIPLGGSRRGIPRLYLNLMITMALSGLWHGAAWHFVLWGALQGAAMEVNHAWRLVWRPLHTWWSHTIARLVTFFALGMLLVLYRAPSMEVALRVYRGMVNLPASWHDVFGPLGEAMRWLGVRFDGPPVAADQLVLVAWLIVWIAV